MMEATGARPVTMHDIAARCGVGQATVSRTLRGDRHVAPATAARIHAAARELGYELSLNEAARRLVSRRYGAAPLNHLIALLFPQSFQEDAYFLRIYQGILDVLQREGFTALTIPLLFGESDPQELHTLLLRHDVDGILFPCGHMTAQVVATFQQTPALSRKPMVSLVYEHVALPSVIPDEFYGGYLAARHLLDLGHRHFIQYTHPGASAAGWAYPANRIAGVVHALTLAGLDASQHLHFLTAPGRWYYPIHVNEDDAKRELHDSLEKYAGAQLPALLASRPEITAILALNDANAVRLRYLLQEHGRQVPQDLSLVGFDDVTPMLNAQGINTLTTIHMPLRALGQQGAECLLGLIAGNASPSQPVVLPPMLIVRGSTAPPRAESEIQASSAR